MKPRKIEIGSGNPSSKPMKSLNAAWEKADMGAILPHARIAPMADSWFHTFAIGLSDFRPAASLFLIAWRKSWIELSRVLFLDRLVWHRLRVRTPRSSCRRICRADGLINLAGGVRSVRLIGGVY